MDIRLTPLAVGAEVGGFAEGMESDAAVREQLYSAWLEHGILLFRNVASVERHLAISTMFGDLEVHPIPEVRSTISPYLIEIGNRADQPRRPQTVYLFDGEPRVNRIAWHRDTAYSPDICKGAVLRMLEVPSRLGETGFADTAAAYDDLPVEMKRRLETLEFKATIRTAHRKTIGHPGIFWQTIEVAADEDYPGNAERASNDGKIDLPERYPSVVHPAVLEHPETGRKSLFISPTYVDRFLGLDKAESDELLRYLTDHILQPRYVYLHPWQADDAIIWDNRRMLHAGMGSVPGDPRFGLRTTLSGAIRTGRYFDSEARPTAEKLAD